MFDLAGFGADELYVTNLVKRRPPANRDPTAAEIAFYTPWLLEVHTTRNGSVPHNGSAPLPTQT